MIYCLCENWKSRENDIDLRILEIVKFLRSTALISVQIFSWPIVFLWQNLTSHGCVVLLHSDDREYFLLGIIWSGNLTLRFVHCLRLGFLEAESEMWPLVKGVYWGQLLSVETWKSVRNKRGQGKQLANMWVELTPSHSLSPNPTPELHRTQVPWECTSHPAWKQRKIPFFILLVTDWRPSSLLVGFLILKYLITKWVCPGFLMTF